MNLPLLVVGLIGTTLRVSTTQKDVDLGNLLLAGAIIATVAQSQAVDA